MTKQTLEELIEMQKAIAICECIINDIVEGYKPQNTQNGGRSSRFYARGYEKNAYRLIRHLPSSL